MPSSPGTREAGSARRWLLGVLVLGLAGTGADLLLLEHYEEAAQLLPVGLIAIALGVLGWHAGRRDAASLLALQIVMALFLMASVVGLALHFRGAAAFQRELNPDMSGMDLVRRAVRAKAPPMLAPGAMLQLGLIGLVYARLESRDRRDM